MWRIIVVFVLLICCVSHVVSQQVWLHPNAGQWDDRISYKVEASIGEVLIQKTGIVYHLNNLSESRHNHEALHNESYVNHTIQALFIESNESPIIEELTPSFFYRNYLFGTNESKWRSHVKSYQTVKMDNLYPGISINYSTKSNGLSYSFRLKPGADAMLIQREFLGQDSLSINDEGELVIYNRFGFIKESPPIAWCDKEGKRDYVDVEYELNGNVLSFAFPSGYNDALPLVIDPDITFSTFSGSTADNWGMSATPDEAGNLFAGGVAFAQGYPTTIGVYDANYNGGQVDVAISKFTADGSDLIYSTYLGGNGSETPNSMICDESGELYIFGFTSSSNFPMAGTPYSSTYRSGPNVQSSANGLGFSEGTDLYVARLSADGSTLLASTYIGGTSTDGFNIGALRYNYGDQFRGEIVLDEANNVYITSSTQSSDFPIVLGAQSSLGGTQDAIAFKMSSNLSSLLWSTYFGGSGLESGNSIQLNSTGNVFIVGGTTSTNLGVTGGEDLTFNGGQADGFIVQLDGGTGALMSGSYIGMGEYDQAYCVQMDLDDNVYVLGQTESSWPITPGLYGVANSGQFIRKYATDLSSILWTTMVGAGSGHVEISPTAFLVSDCYDIYFSGWGGQLNSNYGQASFSTTNGFPITTDAYQSNTSGNNFYISVLGPDASSLKYGTFMGGLNGSANHVDGGTSRFDKQGRIYHAVCAACGGNPNGFTSTPGVWSTTNNSSNCNLAAFKFELSTIEAVVAVPQTVVCMPDPVVFSNNSANGNSFYWDFGDNSSSTQVNPTHLYADTGVYNVVLVVSDTNGCFTPDSVEFQVTIGNFEGGVIQPTSSICPGEQYQLEAFGGTMYNWSPGVFLDDSTSATPTATVFQTTDFTVVVSNTCGIDTVYVTLPVFAGNSSISNDTSVCLGNSVDLFVEGGGSYTWSPSTYLDDPSSDNPLCSPDTTTLYSVEIITPNGCTLNEDVLVSVYYILPVPILEDTLTLCHGSSVEITAGGGDTYMWYPTTFTSGTVFSPTIQVNPPNDFLYYCDFTNACGTVTDSVFIDVKTPSISAGNDTTICPRDSVPIWASGGVNYTWSPQTGIQSQGSLQDSLLVFPNVPTVYTVVGEDEFGCIDNDSVTISFYPSPSVDAGVDVFAFYGDEVSLSATASGNVTYSWSPITDLNCVSCSNPVASPNHTTSYTVTVTDINSCKASDVVVIHYDGTLFIPNTFTPDEDEFNQLFKAYGGNINQFKMTIYNRWGELIFETNNMDFGWDGTYQGQVCQDGTYIWKVTYTDLEDNSHQLVGHVNLLR